MKTACFSRLGKKNFISGFDPIYEYGEQVLMNKFKLYSLQFLVLAAAIGLSADVWLQKWRSSSLCMTESCKVVGEYVRFGEITLVLAGAIFFWVLWLFIFFAGRYERRWLWNVILLALLGALAFDGGLLGFQFMAVREKCQLCIGVAVFLFFAAALLSWNRKKVFIFILACAVWAGGFASTSVLEYKNSEVRLNDIKVLTRQGEEDRDWPVFYFFFGLHCPHCSEVLANLAVNNHDPFTWNLIPLNEEKQDLARIKAILETEEFEENAFLAVLRVESSEDEEIDPGRPPEKVIQGIKKAKEYFSSRGYKGVPLLIVQENPGKRVVLQGRNTIMRYLKQKKLVMRTVDLSGAAGKNDGLKKGE